MTAATPELVARAKDSPPRDLSESENDRLRPLLLKLLETRTQPQLAEETGWSQSWISGFKNGGERTGASWRKAIQLCTLAGADVYEILDIPRPRALSAPLGTPDMLADEFLLRIGTTPGLQSAIVEHRGRWRLSTVARALSVPHQQSRADGIPLLGWERILDGIEAGRYETTTGDADVMNTAAAIQVGYRPPLPRKPGA